MVDAEAGGSKLERMTTNLADNLRYLRARRELTQAQLAKRAGLPRTTVANAETGLANPTLAVLSALADALQLSIEELLSTPQASCRLYPKGSLPLEKKGRGGKVEVHKLLPDVVPGMEIDRMEFMAGSTFTGVPHRPGTREYLACEAGSITLHAGGERLDLHPGDVAVFQGDQPHSYRNHGRAPAVGFSVVTLIGQRTP